MEAEPDAEDFNFRELLGVSLFQTLRNPGREGESAAIGQVHDNTIQLAIVAGRRGTRLGLQNMFPALRRCIELGVSNISHEFRSIVPAGKPAAFSRFAWRVEDRRDANSPEQFGCAIGTYEIDLGLAVTEHVDMGRFVIIGKDDNV